MELISDIKFEKAKEKKDFFGRVAAPPTIATAQNVLAKPKEVNMKEAGRVFYKFNEGFSNAVRTTLYMKSLL